MTLTASPPRAVSLYLTFMSRPVSRIVLTTLSSETTWLPSPRSAREAWRLACCLHPRVQPAPLPPLADHLVTGEPAMPDPLDFVLCAIERGNEREGHCGASGRLWEAT